MNDKPQDKSKSKTFTEEEFNKKLTEEMNKQPRVSYSIAHSYTQAGRCPKLEIRIEGGEPTKSHDLMVAIEGLILDYAKQNPPKNEDVLPNKPHYLPADSSRAAEQ